jgi:two-component system, LytTR family, response regulator
LIPVKVLIVDDEKLGRSNLQFALAEYPHWQLVGSCDQAATAFALVQSQQIDVVLLDVQMPVENGVSLAWRLAELAKPPLVVFITAYNSYAVDAFEMHALDYLLKPFNDERFSQMVQRVEAMLALQQQLAYAGAIRSYQQDSVESQSAEQAFLQQIHVRSVGKIELVQVADLQYAVAAGNYVELHLSQRMVLHRIPISQFADRLNPGEFMRVHRSVIVRISQISSLEVAGDGVYHLTLVCNSKVPVSERYIAQVKQLLR